MVSSFLLPASPSFFSWNYLLELAWYPQTLTFQLPLLAFRSFDYFVGWKPNNLSVWQLWGGHFADDSSARNIYHAWTSRGWTSGPVTAPLVSWESIPFTERLSKNSISFTQPHSSISLHLLPRLPRKHLANTALSAIDSPQADSFDRKARHKGKETQGIAHLFGLPVLEKFETIPKSMFSKHDWPSKQHFLM